MKIEGLITNYDAAGTINPRRICKFDASDTTVVQASAATDALLGVSDPVGTELYGVPDSNGVVNTGEPVDVHRNGIAPVDYGGNVTRGDPLTSDANGKAVAANPSSGSNVRIIGYAEVSGVDGDVGAVFIAPGVMQG